MNDIVVNDCKIMSYGQVTEMYVYVTSVQNHNQLLLGLPQKLKTECAKLSKNNKYIIGVKGGKNKDFLTE